MVLVERGERLHHRAVHELGLLEHLLALLVLLGEVALLGVLQILDKRRDALAEH